jgi:hypothetical protein
VEEKLEQGQLDLFKDLAVAQVGAQADPNRSEADEARSMRERIAAIVCIPGMAGAMALTSWTQWNVAVGIGSFALLFATLWLYCDRGERLAAILRMRKE